MSIPKTTKRPLDSPHGRPAVDVLAALEVSVVTGLSEMEAGHRLRQYGPNTIGRRQRAGAFAVLIHQFQSVVVALLAMAAGLAFYFGEWEEGSAIVGVLALNTLIGFVTEIRAVRSIEALRVLGTRSARVCRDGCARLIPAERLVPGDIVLLDAGDVIAADLRLVEASNLDVDQVPAHRGVDGSKQDHRPRRRQRPSRRSRIDALQGYEHYPWQRGRCCCRDRYGHRAGPHLAAR